MTAFLPRDTHCWHTHSFADDQINRTQRECNLVRSAELIGFEYSSGHFAGADESQSHMSEKRSDVS